MTANVLQIIRRAKDPMAKTDVAAVSGLSLSAVSDHIERLLKENLIQVSNIGNSSGGRKPRLYTLNKDVGYIISVELGTSSVQVALTDFDCNILCYDRSPVNLSEGPETVLTYIYKMVEQLMLEHHISKSTVLGIGIGIPGPVEFASGLPISPPIMPGWDRYPIREFWSQYFDCPCYVDNDVNIMALGEHAKGLNFEIDNLIYIKIGTGIGAGIIYDGKLYRGSSGSAGDIGHFDVGADVNCWCGNTGCLEAVAGGKAIASKAKELALAGRSDFLLDIVEEKGGLTLKDIGLGIQRLDSLSVELIRDSGALIGRVLASLVNYSNPSLISIGGGVSEFGDIVLAAIRQGIYQRSLPLATRNLIINKSILGRKAGLIGGAFMTIDQLIINSTDDNAHTFFEPKAKLQ
ncbi:ROK family transcriptional regulator [Paenibacillus validus]|uniref:ROK family protein n=2 Tax=Paenibacillus TaxID=44249 RepID=A0A7X3CWE5_9BACL|nr:MULTISPECIES: ROK family transcriptional regulator [Paenibacillus]MED4600538.1 ROK family transcriptional regulator [Paenibacillus validus]MED4604797.1 ROK family transcriptional regulator [Paenibacillus validus]MUG74112.1 ROK family protein [Paenibacillus validus]